MDDIPADFQELAKALDEPEPSDWSVGSAEGGWATPTESEWGAQPIDASHRDEPDNVRSRSRRRRGA